MPSRARTRRFYRHGLLTQLLVFEAVARLGSVTRAAAELHLAQPTVSLQIKKLAATLEVTLFEQKGRALRLTPAGHSLQESCGELIHCLVRTDTKLDAWRRPAPAETLRLAAEPEGRSEAARLLADFCSRHPGVQASLHIGERAELLTRLATGADDVYLFALDIEDLPADRRWSLAHPKGRALTPAASLFMREALRPQQEGPLKSREQREAEGFWSGE